MRRRRKGDGWSESSWKSSVVMRRKDDSWSVRGAERKRSDVFKRER